MEKKQKPPFVPGDTWLTDIRSLAKITERVLLWSTGRDGVYRFTVGQSGAAASIVVEVRVYDSLGEPNWRQATEDERSRACRCAVEDLLATSAERKEP